MVRILQLLSGLLYPLLVYFALQYASPRIIGAACIALLLLRHRRQGGELWSGLAGVQKGTLGVLIAVSVAISWLNSEPLLRIMPALISLSMLVLFGFTLKHPPSMIERFARLTTPQLPEEGVVYTRTITIIWCGFFIVNAMIAGWTALYASRETWVLYNGLISYGLMGLLFAGEWLYRRWRIPGAA